MKFKEHEMTEDEESIWNADRCLYLEEIEANAEEHSADEVSAMFGGD